MLRHKRFGVVTLSLLVLCLIASSAASVKAQEGNPSRPAQPVRRDDINYDVQLYLLVASNEAGERAAGSGGIPQSLESTVRQLRTTLPFTNYRLATTFLNRVKDNGTIELKGVASTLMPSPIGPTSPTFYEFRLAQLKAETDPEGQPFLRTHSFRFGLRMPVVTGTTRVEGSDVGSPIIQYEPVGVNTELSLREGVPTVVGTMTTSRPNESLVLLLSVRRNPSR